MIDLLVITGASKGIGNSIFEKLKSSAKEVIAISSSSGIHNLGCDPLSSVLPIEIDLSDYQNKNLQVITNVANRINPQSIGIVLCAAQLGQPGGLLDTDLESWDNSYKLNVLGNLAVIKSLSNHIKKVKTRVVMFAGGGSAYGYESWSGYSLSKTAVVRAVENLALEVSKVNKDFSVIALAPGAVKTDMLAKVVASGSPVKTFTDISEPTNFVYNFLTDEFDSVSLNGRFLHVRDNFTVNGSLSNSANQNLFKLRRIE